MAPSKYFLLILFSIFVLEMKKIILNFNKILERALSSNYVSLRRREFRLFSQKLKMATYPNPSN